MGILEKLNNLKAVIKDISNNIDELPEEIKSEVDARFKALRSMVNEVGGIIEKHFKDETSLKKISKDLINRMDSLEIYKGITDRQKEAIVEKIVEDKSLVLIDSDGLSSFIEDKLKSDSVENLVKKAYSKKDIIKLGEAVVSHDSNEVVKYDAGVGILRDMVKTPTGRKDAIAYGIKRLMGNATTLQYYLMLYYRVQ